MGASGRKDRKQGEGHQAAPSVLRQGLGFPVWGMWYGSFPGGAARALPSLERPRGSRREDRSLGSSLCACLEGFLLAPPSIVPTSLVTERGLGHPQEPDSWHSKVFSRLGPVELREVALLPALVLEPSPPAMLLLTLRGSSRKD